MMPPLPEAHIKRPSFIYDITGEVCGIAPDLESYTPKQMHEYGKSCRAQALAEAANIALNEKLASQTSAHSIRFIDTHNDACDDCAKAIERLV